VLIGDDPGQDGAADREHAERGAGGEDNNPDYYKAKHGAKQIWKIATSHTHGLSARPKEYDRRVIGFFDRSLRAE